jgi:two-component system, sensor histidine kinase and response regulator
MKKPVILCVDDESIITDALKDQLQKSFGKEFTIEISDSGDDALEYYLELMDDMQEAPVVIADYIMPGMKGDELLVKISQKNHSCKTILLTGQASLDGVANAVNNANLYRYISKPWNKDDLVLTIKEALKSYQQEKIILEQNKALAELNKSLEAKVEERTVQLQRLNATKDKFFSIIAHDLKNPFNSMLGFSKYMLESLDEIEKEDRILMLQAMVDAADNGYKLLENLLEWARAQTGHLKWYPEAIFLEAIVSETKDLLKNALDAKRITLNIDLPMHFEVFADGNMITALIRNLLSNAIKYSYEGGAISIRGEDKARSIQICIKDSGIGIKEENIEKLFKIDAGFSTNGTAQESGTGLGLILCKEFVERNKGDIWVMSEYGKGSTFCFSIPKKKD